MSFGWSDSNLRAADCACIALSLLCRSSALFCIANAPRLSAVPELEPTLGLSILKKVSSGEAKFFEIKPCSRFSRKRNENSAREFVLSISYAGCLIRNRRLMRQIWNRRLMSLLRPRRNYECSFRSAFETH